MSKAEALKFDPDVMTVGDVEDFEQITGIDFEECLDAAGNMTIPPGSTGKVLKAIVYILKRRADPTFTLEDARNVKVTELADGEAVPLDTPPAEPASTSPLLTSGI